MSTGLSSLAAGEAREAEGRRAALSLALALALHAVLLFAVRLPSPPATPAVSTTEVEVALVARAPAPPPALPESRPPELATPQRVAPPEPAAPQVPVRRAPPEPRAEPEKPSAAEAPPSLSEGLADSEAEVVPAPAVSRAREPAATVVRARIAAVPRYRHNPEPHYPATARRRGQEGMVLLAVRVSAAGVVEAVAVRTGSGVPDLDRAAVEAVERWAFDPALEDGEPVAAEVEVPIRFELDQGG